MKLLNTYDDKYEAEDAAAKLQGNRRLASERDSTVVIYNLSLPSQCEQGLGVAVLFRVYGRL